MAISRGLLQCASRFFARPEVQQGLIDGAVIATVGTFQILAQDCISRYSNNEPNSPSNSSSDQKPSLKR